MNISSNGLAMIKNAEGFYPTTYDDLNPKAKLTPNSKISGTLTIGYGHTGKDVKIGQTMTEPQASAVLVQELKQFVDGVNQMVTIQLNQNQFDSLVSFCYNLGNSTLKNSTLLKLVNSKDFIGASKEFGKFIHAMGIPMTGLVNRRNAEMKLFLTPVIAPKPVTPIKPITPASKPVPKPASPKPVIKPVTYVIQKGDNLTQIAKRFGTTVATLEKLNNLDNRDLIYAGNTLRIK